jgi:hypothetical protein
MQRVIQLYPIEDMFTCRKFGKQSTSFAVLIHHHMPAWPAGQWVASTAILPASQQLQIKPSRIRKFGHTGGVNLSTN